MRSSVVAASLMLSFAVAGARAELASGPKAGEQVQYFPVIKVAGNPADGIANGTELCYRCKTGKKPVVLLFARTADDRLARLLKKLDEEIEEHEKDQLTSYVGLIGADEATLAKRATDFVAKHGIERIAFVVPKEAEQGPAAYALAPEADLTVVYYKGGTVTSTRGFAAGELADDSIDAVVHAACELVE